MLYLLQSEHDINQSKSFFFCCCIISSSFTYGKNGNKKTHLSGRNLSGSGKYFSSLYIVLVIILTTTSFLMSTPLIVQSCVHVLVTLKTKNILLTATSTIFKFSYSLIYDSDLQVNIRIQEQKIKFRPVGLAVIHTKSTI